MTRMFRFRHIAPHLAALVVIALCIRLALWQVDRAGEKDELLERWNQADAVSLAEGDREDALHALVSAIGKFDGHRQILYDNQVRNMNAGVHVFTPFKPVGDDRIWLVNRGWQPLDRRTALPDPEVVPGPIRLSGRIAEPPRVGLQIGQAGPLDAENWPNLMTYLDMGRVREVFGDSLAERVILLDPEHPAHLTGDEWQPVIFGPDRHRAYAFQWGTIAVVVFLIWLVLTARSWRNP